MSTFQSFGEIYTSDVFPSTSYCVSTMIFSFFIKIAKVFSSISITYFEVIYNLMNWLQNQKKWYLFYPTPCHILWHYCRNKISWSAYQASLAGAFSLLELTMPVKLFGQQKRTNLKARREIVFLIELRCHDSKVFLRNN